MYYIYDHSIHIIQRSVIRHPHAVIPDRRRRRLPLGLHGAGIATFSFLRFKYRLLPIILCLDG
jgi:hypothetical protein